MLPLEIWLLILSYIKYPQIIKFNLVCKFLFDALIDESFWDRRLYLDYSIKYNLIINDSKIKTHDPKYYYMVISKIKHYYPYYKYYYFPYNLNWIKLYNVLKNKILDHIIVIYNRDPLIITNGQSTTFVHYDIILPSGTIFSYNSFDSFGRLIKVSFLRESNDYYIVSFLNEYKYSLYSPKKKFNIYNYLYKLKGYSINSLSSKRTLDIIQRLDFDPSLSSYVNNAIDEINMIIGYKKYN